MNYSPGSTTSSSATSTVRRENHPICYCQALAEAKQTLKDSDADKAKLSQVLKTTKTAYTATCDNLASKSRESNDAVIRE
jgi:hypothetical protein